MVGLKTAVFIVLLNNFSLNSSICSADAFYDSLKATGKTDSTTTATVRSNTVDSARRKQMNSITQNNSDYVAPSKLTTPTFSDADLKKMKDEESTQLESAEDISDKQIAAKLRKDAGKDDVPLAAGSVKSPAVTAAALPTRGRGPTVATQNADRPAIKVTNTDPDEVDFPGDDSKTAKSAKKK